MTPPLTDAELEELERLADRARYAYAPDVVQITDAIDALVAEVRALRAAADHHSTVINEQMSQLAAVTLTRDEYRTELEHALARLAADDHIRREHQAETLRLQRERDEAREALERYGEHDGDCAASVIGCPADTVCTCGYDAALSTSPATVTERNDPR